MSKKEGLELARWVVTMAKKAGVTDIAVNLSRSRDIEVQCRERILEQLKESTENSLSLDIYVNGRYSSHSTNDIRKESLGKFTQDAVAMTKYLTEDPYRTLPDPQYYAGRKNLDLHLYDPAYEGLSSDERVRIARDIEDAALSQSDKIVSCTTGFSDSSYESIKVHSNDFEGYRRGTKFSAGAEVTVKDRQDRRPEDWDWRTVRFLKDLPSADVLGKSAVDRALRKIGQAKIASGLYDIVVANRAGSRLLYALYGPMQAGSLQQRNSFLEGKLGERIGSDKLTWIDEPFISTALGSRLYDSEGMTTKRRIMIDKGVLQSYYIDWYYGQKLSTDPTTGSMTNVTFEYGDKSMDELVKQMNKGILITGFIGGNSNSLSGDFSYGVYGMYVEDGQIVKPVSEMNVSGNSAEFWNKLAAVGNDPYIYSSWRRPSMYFKDIQFSGI